MVFITYFGEWQIILPVALAISAVFFILKSRRYTFAFIASVAGGEMIIQLLKNIIERPRPPAIDALITTNGFSFPSGHSFIAVSFYGFIAYFLFCSLKKKTVKIISLCLSVIIILLIGFSRIYLGAHWPSDVLASYGLALIWLFLIIAVFKIKNVYIEHKQH